MDFGATRVGDDAIGAEFVAAASDADVGLGHVVAGGDAAGKIEHFQAILGCFQRRASAYGCAHQGRLARAAAAGGDGGVVDQRCQLIQFAGAAEDVNVRVFPENVDAVALGHAADDADDQVRIVGFAFPQLAQARPDLLLGMFANRAGVIKNDIGLVAIVHGLITVSAKLPQNQLAVEHVHLAAEGFQVELAAHGRRLFCGQSRGNTTDAVNRQAELRSCANCLLEVRSATAAIVCAEAETLRFPRFFAMSWRRDGFPRSGRQTRAEVRRVMRRKAWRPNPIPGAIRQSRFRRGATAEAERLGQGFSSAGFQGRIRAQSRERHGHQRQQKNRRHHGKTRSPPGCVHHGCAPCERRI